jgi:hypothetical protein
MLTSGKKVGISGAAKKNQIPKSRISNEQILDKLLSARLSRLI